MEEKVAEVRTRRMKAIRGQEGVGGEGDGRGGGDGGPRQNEAVEGKGKQGATMTINEHEHGQVQDGEDDETPHLGDRLELVPEQHREDGHGRQRG